MTRANGKRHIFIRIREIEAAMKRAAKTTVVARKIARKTSLMERRGWVRFGEASLAEDGTAEVGEKRCWL